MYATVRDGFNILFKLLRTKAQTVDAAVDMHLLPFVKVHQ